MYMNRVFFYPQGFSKQNITFFTVKHIYALTADVNDKKPVFCASEAERHVGITLSVVCLSVRPSVRLSVRLSHFWFAYNFFNLRDRAFIFGMCVPYDKAFQMVPSILST